MKKSKDVKRSKQQEELRLIQLAEESRDYGRGSKQTASGQKRPAQNTRPTQNTRSGARVQARQNAAPVNKKEEKKRKSRNKTFAGMTYAFVTLFILLMGYIVYFNVFRAQEIINSPYNPRTDLMADRVNRGTITASDGTVLARTVTDEDGDSVREYPYSNVYAHVVGYNSNGKSGIESIENFSLLNSHAFFPERILNEFKDEKNQGDTVVTTLDTRLQQAAYDAMGSNNGALVAIQPSTGKILAMVSKPDFDPNSVEDNWDYYNSEQSDSALLNRATQGAYAPGSTFKILTALEYTREYSDFDSYSYTCNGSITQGDTTISCYNGSVHGTQDLLSSFANSCNSSFSNIGMLLDGDSYRNTCEELLFNKELPGPFTTRVSQFTVDGTSGYATKMMTAMGQGETLTNPYHMALIVSAIANGGTLMEPYVVEQVQNSGGSVVRKNSPSTYKKLMSSSEASRLTELMKAVVTQGTATELYNDTYSVAGKTGTAEYSDDKSLAHSWFVGFSNVDNPDLVVAVVIEGYDGNASARSLPVAKAVFDAYYYQ